MCRYVHTCFVTYPVFTQPQYHSCVCLLLIISCVLLMSVFMMIGRVSLFYAMVMLAVLHVKQSTCTLPSTCVSEASLNLSLMHLVSASQLEQVQHSWIIKLSLHCISAICVLLHGPLLVHPPHHPCHGQLHLRLLWPGGQVQLCLWPAGGAGGGQDGGEEGV